MQILQTWSNAGDVAGRSQGEERGEGPNGFGKSKCRWVNSDAMNRSIEKSYSTAVSLYDRVCHCAIVVTATLLKPIGSFPVKPCKSWDSGSQRQRTLPFAKERPEVFLEVSRVCFRRGQQAQKALKVTFWSILKLKHSNMTSIDWFSLSVAHKTHWVPQSKMMEKWVLFFFDTQTYQTYLYCHLG